MDQQFAQHIPRLRELCEQHKFQKLWVFGSVLRTSFRSDSDIDFLYELADEPMTDEQFYLCFWGFVDAATELLGHPIDMVWYSGLKNPYFKAEVDEQKVLLYESEGQKIAV